MAQHFAGLVSIQIGDHDGLDLRVLVANDVGDGARFHPLQAVQTAGVATQQDAVDEAVGFVFAQGLSEHLANVAVGADAHAGLVADDVDEFAHHLLDLLAVHVAHLRHGHAHALNLFRAHVTQHLRSIRLTQGEEQDRSLINSAHFDRSSTTITHLC